MIVSHREQIEAFFEAYGRRSNDALQEPPREDVEGIAAAFAPFFVGAGPRGVMGGVNGTEFRQAIPQGLARYRSVGGRSLQITRLRISEFDDFNAMARVDWQFDYERPRDARPGTIVFQNLYFLNFAEGEPKIFAYITPDEEQAMRDHGLLD